MAAPAVLGALALAVLAAPAYATAAPAPAPKLVAIKVGNSPEGIAVNPNKDTVYVADLQGGLMSVINGKTNKVIATIPVSQDPQDVEVSPLTGDVFVLNNNLQGNSTVSVISGKTNKIVAAVTVAFNPFGLAVDPRTGDVYVSGGAHGRVQVISGNTDKVIATVVTGVVGQIAVNRVPATSTSATPMATRSWRSRANADPVAVAAGRR